ncbi:transposase [Streptomyces sp. NPDC012756]|uniref:transposase n=1 Tax=Streptomyces sp. NPDC012756 TaxID=3364847 RepID=UPI0036C26D21
MLDAGRYLVDNGTKWRVMPADFPPWDRVYAFFRRWRDHGMVKEFHDRLRSKVREQAGREPEPTAGVIDGGKLVNGRKRHAVVDTLGLLLGVIVTSADIGDRAAGQVLLAQVAAAHHRPVLVWADGGYTGSLVEYALAALALVLAIVKRSVTACAASSCCPSGGSWSFPRSWKSFTGAPKGSGPSARRCWSSPGRFRSSRSPEVVGPSGLPADHGGARRDRRPTAGVAGVRGMRP